MNNEHFFGLILRPALAYAVKTLFKVLAVGLDIVGMDNSVVEESQGDG